jgi:tRNA-dihydrouridine synthase A
MNAPARPTLAVAPMMGHTDRAFRLVMRRLTRCTRLSTEMQPAPRIVAARAHDLRPIDREQSPLSVQLGGSDPRELAAAARIVADLGADEIDLNAGCPSPAAAHGCFGAALLADPQRLADAVAAMADAVSVPVTVKVRLGLASDDGSELVRVLEALRASGVARVIVHARRALLGRRARDSLRVPPLRPEVVHAIAGRPDAPALELNGGIADLAQAALHARTSPIAGVMIGRAAIEDPWRLAHADRAWYGQHDPHRGRADALARIADLVALHPNLAPAIARAAVGLIAGFSGARRLRAAVMADARRLADAAAELGRHATEAAA